MCSCHNFVAWSAFTAQLPRVLKVLYIIIKVAVLPIPIIVWQHRVCKKKIEMGIKVTLRYRAYLYRGAYERLFFSSGAGCFPETGWYSAVVVHVTCPRCAAPRACKL